VNLLHRIRNLFGRGRITLVNDSGTIQVVQVKTTDSDVSDERIRMAEFGFTSYPPDGSEALLLHIAGNRYDGAVVATNHQPSRPTGLQSGESMLYSQDGKHVYLTADGGIVINANSQPVTVNGATTVTINAATKVRMVTPRLECTGDIVDNCDTTGRSMVADRQIYDGHNHAVTGVQPGSGTVTSNAPSQPE